MSYFEVKLHQIRFRLHWGAGGAYSAPAGPQLALKGPNSKGREGNGSEREGRESIDIKHVLLFHSCHVFTFLTVFICQLFLFKKVH